MSAVKKGVKKVGRFVRKHWKAIVIAAAIVFTAGLAAVGTAGFAAVAGSKGLMVAIGSTLKTGVIAIGGTIGIGKGVVAGGSAIAGGAGSAAGMLGASAVGAAAPAAAINAGAALAAGAGAGTITTLGTVTALGAAPAAAGLGAFGTAAVGAGTAAAASAMAGKPALSQVAVPGQERLAYQHQTPPQYARTALNVPPQTMMGKIGTAAGNFVKLPGVASALVTGGLGAVSSYMAASQQEDEDKAINAMYGASKDSRYASLTPDQMRFTSPIESKNSWRPRLMYDA